MFKQCVLFSYDLSYVIFVVVFVVILSYIESSEGHVWDIHHAMDVLTFFGQALCLGSRIIRLMFDITSMGKPVDLI